MFSDSLLFKATMEKQHSNLSPVLTGFFFFRFYIYVCIFNLMCFVQFLWKYVARKKSGTLYENICFMSGSFHSFIFLCVLKVRNLPTLARRQVWKGIKTWWLFIISDIQVQKHSLPNSWSTYALGELSLEWYSSCLHVTVLHGNCMHGSSLACTVLLT